MIQMWCPGPESVDTSAPRRRTLAASRARLGGSLTL
jgi:hypothetical protein